MSIDIVANFIKFNLENNVHYRARVSLLNNRKSKDYTDNLVIRTGVELPVLLRDARHYIASITSQIYDVLNSMEDSKVYAVLNNKRILDEVLGKIDMERGIHGDDFFLQKRD